MSSNFTALIKAKQSFQNAKLRSIEKVYQSRQVIVSGIPETPKATSQQIESLVCELFGRMLKIPCGGVKQPQTLQVERAERIGERGIIL